MTKNRVLLLRASPFGKSAWRDAQDITDNAEIILSTMMAERLVKNGIITEPGEYAVLVLYVDTAPESFFFTVEQDVPAPPPLKIVW